VTSVVQQRAQLAGAPLSTRHRPTGYVALAVALIVGLGALGYYLYTSAGHKVPVVMAVHDIPAGHAISRADLTTVEVAGDIPAIAGRSIDQVVGLRTTVEVLPNTLIQNSMLSHGPGLAAGQVQVGVAVVAGQLPSAGLQAGDKVTVIGLPSKTDIANSASSAAVVLLASAVVFDSRSNPTNTGGQLLTLIVPAEAAANIAAFSSVGLVALIKIAS
jgi:hypothetical protein